MKLHVSIEGKYVCAFTVLTYNNKRYYAMTRSATSLI